MAGGSFSWAGPQGTYDVTVMVGDKEVLKQTLNLNSANVKVDWKVGAP